MTKEQREGFMRALKRYAHKQAMKTVRAKIDEITGQTDLTIAQMTPEQQTLLMEFLEQ